MENEMEYRNSSIWFKDEILDPNQLLAEFFTMADVADYRKDIYNIVRAACSGKYWKKGSPNDMIFILKGLESIVNAAYILYRQGKQSPLQIEDRDIFNLNLFRGNSSTDRDWDFFPRMLRYNEYLDPYIVFKRFFDFKNLSEWKEVLQSLSEYALSRTRIFEEYEDFDSLAIYRHLTRLVEATHLIDVRENTHVGGYIKNKISRRES